MDVGEGQIYLLSTYSSWQAMKRMKDALRLRRVPAGHASPEDWSCSVASPTEGLFGRRRWHPLRHSLLLYNAIASCAWVFCR